MGKTEKILGAIEGINLLIILISSVLGKTMIFKFGTKTLTLLEANVLIVIVPIFLYGVTKLLDNF